MEEKKKRKRSSSNRKKNGRYVSKKRRRLRERRLGMIFVLLLVVFVVVLILAAQYIDLDNSPETNETAAPAATESTAPAPETQAPATVQTVPPETEKIPEATIPTDAMAAYSEVFIRYQRAVSESWDIDRCEENQISYMVSFLENLDRLGYYLVDLDGDSHPELIISDGNNIYDMYALTTKGVHWVLTGAERNAWSLCEGNILKNIGSNGAASSLYDFYTWDGANLVTERNVIFNGAMDTPWSTIYQNQQQVISEAEADALIDSFVQIRIPTQKIPE